MKQRRLLFRSRARNSERDHQERTLSGGVRLEKFCRVIVVERESRRAATERIRRKISAPTENPGLEMRVAVAAIAERVQRAFKIRHVNDQRRTIHAERLFEAQVSRLAAEVSGVQPLERARSAGG